jgi:hypothetical protein
VDILSRADNPQAIKPAKEVMLTLSGALSASDALSLKLGSAVNLGASGFIVDRSGNYILTSSSHRITDLGLAVAEPQSATDGVHSGDLPTRALGALRTFDGSGRLYDRNITVGVRLADGVLASLPVSLYFDSSPEASLLLQPLVTQSGGAEAQMQVWSPDSVPGVFPNPNGAARVASSLAASGQNRSFIIPSSDPEMASGATIEFALKVADLYCVRSIDPADPRNFDMFRFRIQDITQQRGGVTILNNVIDPTRGEKTSIQIELKTSGYLTVQVFTLDGDLVRVLSRSPTASGSFFYTWDGLNGAGRAVARGMYFIRVVGPGIDEIRKVMIVKPR